jgi:NADH:ubiquinone oxidoreductase subunit 3 (subunit A)
MSNGIEPEVKDFLKRVLQTVSTGMLFLLTNMTFGLYFNWAFYSQEITAGNIIYYCFFISSFIGLLYYYYRLWKQRLSRKD